MMMCMVRGKIICILNDLIQHCRNAVFMSIATATSLHTHTSVVSSMQPSMICIHPAVLCSTATKHLMRTLDQVKHLQYTIMPMKHEGHLLL